MGSFIENGGVWTQGYRAIAYFQFILVAVLLFSIPLWKRDNNNNEDQEEKQPVSFKELIKIPGVKASLTAFFCYCAIETTMGLWTTTYLSTIKGVDLVFATKCGMLFYIGIALGRFLSGIVSERLGDIKLIITGTTITILSLSALIIPGIEGILLYSLIIVAGMGCGPIFPSMVHYSPAICGNNVSQLLIGCQLAMASAGSIIIPALFGIIVNTISISLMPYFCLMFAAILAIMIQRISRRI